MQRGGGQSSIGEGTTVLWGWVLSGAWNSSAWRELPGGSGYSVQIPGLMMIQGAESPAIPPLERGGGVPWPPCERVEMRKEKSRDRVVGSAGSKIAVRLWTKGGGGGREPQSTCWDTAMFEGGGDRCVRRTEACAWVW